MTSTNYQDQPTEMPIADPLRPAGTPSPAVDTTPNAVAPDGPAPAAVALANRMGGPSRLRVGAVAGAAVALAVGAVATSLAATPPAAAPAAATGSTGTGALAVTIDPLADGQAGAFDHGRRGGPGFGEITVKAISGSNVTLTTDDGWTRTIAVTDAVDLTKGGQDIAPSDLAVGDEVRISQTRNDDGSYTVDAIAVVVPTIRGTVSDLTSGGFKVTTRDGSVWTITVNGSTVYRFGQGDGTAADVADGSEVLVQGTTTADNALTATSVTVPSDHVAGTVTAKTADTIVIRKSDGTSVTVNVDGDTAYRVAGVEGATLADIAVDMTIRVSGREGSATSIDADTVATGRGGDMMPGDGFGPGGHGGRGGPGGPGWDDDSVAEPTPSPSTSS